MLRLFYPVHWEHTPVAINLSGGAVTCCFNFSGIFNLLQTAPNFLVITKALVKVMPWLIQLQINWRIIDRLFSKNNKA